MVSEVTANFSLGSEKITRNLAQLDCLIVFSSRGLYLLFPNGWSCSVKIRQEFECSPKCITILIGDFHFWVPNPRRSNSIAGTFQPNSYTIPLSYPGSRSFALFSLIDLAKNLSHVQTTVASRTVLGRLGPTNPSVQIGSGSVPSVFRMWSALSLNYF